jgi:hypothetical protein
VAKDSPEDLSATQTAAFEVCSCVSFLSPFERLHH